MEPNPEIPKFTPPQVERYFTNLPIELKPKPDILEPWFKYFKGLGFTDYELKTMGEEFTVAHTLRQWIMDRESAEKLKPSLKSAKELKHESIDPARLVRYLILQASYPSGVSLNNERLVFSLDPKLVNKLQEGIKTCIPGYNNLSNEQLERILEDLGFRHSREAGSYINSVDQYGFQKILVEIINTHSHTYTPLE